MVSDKGNKSIGRSVWSAWRRRRRLKSHQRGRKEFEKAQEIFIELHEQLVEEVSSLTLKGDERTQIEKVLAGCIVRNRVDASKVYKLEMLVLEKLDLVQLRFRIISLREILQGLLTKDAWALADAALCREELASARRPAGLLDPGQNQKRPEGQDPLRQDRDQVQVRDRGPGQDPDPGQEKEREKRHDPAFEHQLYVARAQAKALATRIYRRYVLVPAVEKRRTTIVIKLLRGMLAMWVLACLFHMLWHFELWRESMPSLQLIAILSGATGATVSVIRRFYRIDPLHEPLLTWLSIERGALSIYISPLIGAIFGLVLLAVAQAGLLTGALMPDLACTMKIDPETGAGPPVRGCWPATEYAKVAILGFVAGWGERIVPDVLNKLESRSVVGIEKA